MEHLDRGNDQCHIVASSSLTDDHIEVLKQGDTFGLFDRYGDIHSLRKGSQGLYHEGTRFLSRFELTINGERPLLLSSTIKENNVLLNIDLTNPDLMHEGQVEIPRGTLHLSRARFLWHGRCFERLRVHNYSLIPIPIRLSISVDADFADLFEVRGKVRSRRGRRLEAVTSKDGISLGYEGLDRVDRQVILRCMPAPSAVDADEVRFDTLLPAGEAAQWDLSISCEAGTRIRPDLLYEHALTEVEQDIHSASADDCLIVTSNEQFNVWMNRSLADLLPSERFKAFTDAIYFGGPVAARGLFAVVHADEVPGEALKMLPGLYLALLPSTIDALISRPPPKIRFFAGYSGWGTGQLRWEIDRGDWLVVDADPDTVFLKDTSSLWQDMLRRGRSIRADAADRVAPGPNRLPRLARARARRVQPVAAFCAGPGLSFSNCMAPLRYSTRMTSFAENSPSSIRLASGFSRVCWMARLSGRAP